MADPINVDTHRAVVNFVIDINFKFVVQLFQGPSVGIHRQEHLPQVLGELKVKSNFPCLPKE